MTNLFVESFITLDNLSGDPSDIQGDPTEPNTQDWLEVDDLDEDVEMIGAFEDPDVNLEGEQTFQIRLRSSDNEMGDQAEATVELREGSSVVETFISEQEITQDQDGEYFEWTWDATDLSDVSGADVEIGVNGDSTGGMPGDRDTIEVGRVRWVASLAQSVDVETQEATDVGGTEATLHGEVTDYSGADIDQGFEVWFEWGEDGAGMPESTPTQTLADTGTFDETITDLDPDTTYEFRAHVDWVDTGQTDDGDVLTFTTDDLDVSISTEPADEITLDSADIHGDLDLAGFDSADVWFEWGEEGTGLPNTTSTQNLASTGSFDESLDGLDDSTTYEFQAHGESDDGSITDGGDILTFDTEEVSASLLTLAAANVSETGATLQASVDWMGYDQVEVWFEWGEVGSGLPNSTPIQTITETGEHSFDEVITDLEPDTTYEYHPHADVDDGEDTSEGGVETFDTLPVMVDVQLTWTPSTDAHNSQNLYRAIEENSEPDFPFDYEQIKTFFDDTTDDFVDDEALEGETVWYAITAVTGGDESEPDTASIFASYDEPDQPPPPLNFTGEFIDE